MSRSFSISTLHIYFFLGLLLLAGCVAHEKNIPSLHNGHSQLGMASWYGPSFHGKPSASGEPYDMWALTAAHRTLPFGTWVQVTKVETGKKVTVRINDRGPFIKGRIIDLSYGAARELAMIGEGTSDVSLTIVSPPNASIPSIRAPSHFWVQAGAYISLTEAMTLRERLAHDYAHVRVKTVTLPSGEWHRVQIGAFDSKKTAQTVARAFKKNWGVEPTLISSN
ncbi:MAG: septal ring lytic transglycosylase RlpA family protein [Nitrospirota bacterium]|nr:septal ring lytic transglycosylase RlpA family protein [Nitrospirota bacterium]MDX2420915.1 septal ring lytic transglycosylase RlpA family protein [Nitrospirota bacterium]